MNLSQQWIDECYELPKPGKLMDVFTPLPGFRMDSVLPDGRIGSFRDSGLTPQAVCHSTLATFRTPFGSSYADALTHNPKCSCGYRIVRSKRNLAEFAVHVAESQMEGSMSIFLNHAFSTAAGDTSGLVVVECSVPEGATIAYRCVEDEEMPGTIRTNRLQLGKRAYMPRWVGGVDQKPLAKLIRNRYGLRVTLTDEDALSFINSFTPATGSVNGWHKCGEWGLQGAAGVLFTTGSAEDARFLLTKRSPYLPTHPGKWGTPGGALDPGETTLSAVTREVREELGVDSLGGGSVIGATVDERAGGWSYTTFLCHVAEPFAYRIDGSETVKASWVTRKKLEQMARAGELVGPFAAKVPELLRLRETWTESLRELRGHTLAGWR